MIAGFVPNQWKLQNGWVLKEYNAVCLLGRSVESMDFCLAVLNAVTNLWVLYNAVMFSLAEDLLQGFVKLGIQVAWATGFGTLALNPSTPN
jgi:hypothetical protein